MPKNQAGSGSGPVLVSGPSHDPTMELKKQTFVDQEIQCNRDHHPNNDINKGNVTAVITDIQSEPVKADKKKFVFYRPDGTLRPRVPPSPYPKDIQLDLSNDRECDGYEDLFGDEYCGICSKRHITQNCRIYRRQRKRDARKALSGSTPLGVKD